MILRGGNVVLPDRIFDNGTVVIDEALGRIEEVGKPDKVRPPQPDETVLDVTGGFIAPGFIDLHVHGAWDADFMDGTRAAFDTVTAYHALHGTTSVLATSTSAALDVILQMLETTHAAMKSGTRGSAILGVHLEGPWLNREMRGCHMDDHVRPPAPGEWHTMVPFSDAIRMVTLSPEVEGCMDLIRELRDAGIVVSCGHSTITYDEMMIAVEAGVSHVAHIFCAMSTIVRKGPWRHPGVLETALADSRLTTEMIADGKHLPVALMEIAYRCKRAKRLCLVSDAMRGAGMPPGGTYTFGPRDGTEALIADGVAMLPDMTAFASSITPLDAMVRNVVELLALPLHEAVRMASLTPAEVIGANESKGSLEPGKDADLCLLDTDLQVRNTMVRGKILDREQLAALAPPEAAI